MVILYINIQLLIGENMEIKLKIENHIHINQFILFLVENGYKVWCTSPEREYGKQADYYVHFLLKSKEAKKHSKT